MQIRLAIPEDASAILGIYMHYGLEPMTFELESPTLSEMERPKRHIPSGRVALEEIIEWLIVELGVKARQNNWQKVLQTTRKKFKQICTWS